jgi:hypothetical protein
VADGPSPLEQALRDRAKRARDQSAEMDAEEQYMQAASLRGKARGFEESADLVRRLDGRRGVRG